MNTPGGSSLRPAWSKGAGGGGGRGFQPPPTISADRSDQPRSSSWGSQERGDNNKFSALQDEEDEIAGSGQREVGVPRGEAFRTSFSRSSSGPKPSGRSLADLAAQVPENSPAGRRHISNYESRSAGGSGRFSGLRSGDHGNPGTPVSTDSYKPDPKVIRYTREKLLSMRPPSHLGDQSLPATLCHLEGSAVLSKAPQDPVCWDSLDAEAIWEAIRDRRVPAGGKAAGVPSRGLNEAVDEPRRRNTAGGRWQRGVALPPPDEGGRRKDKDAESPDELWDDPMGGATGAASDFSAFGAIPDDDAFDFEKMAEASKKLEEELHGPKNPSDDDIQHQSIKVDPSRPLASVGMTLASGSGNDVNVFEDFDSPSENEAAVDAAAATVRGGQENPNASSRLMKMIGVTRDAPENDNSNGQQISNPWGTSENLAPNPTGLDPLMSIGGATTIPLNPWGIQVPAQQGEANANLSISPQLSSFPGEQRLRDEQAEKRSHEAGMFRRQKEEEAQRRAQAQKQAEEQALRHARASALQQQAASQQSQVELVLMERICTILENSWGRSDLVSILTTLHSEDSRVIPLLGHVDALRALIARSPRRVSLHRDPSFGGDIAVLAMTNSQWQQHQQQLQARLEQEEMERRQLEEAEKSRVPVKTKIDHQAPWFYSDPQNNVQGPFRGDEMRQWLEAGYFKGDLPISQNPQGPFLPLSTLFPDLSVAFRAAVQEVENIGVMLAESKTAIAEISDDIQPDLSNGGSDQPLLIDGQRDRGMIKSAKSDGEEEPQNAGNQSSTQLKMILGLSTDTPPVENTNETEPPEPENPVETQTRSLGIHQTKGSKKAESVKAETKAEDTSPENHKQPSTAWGGATTANPKKSMSEIQQEEARAVAMMERNSAPRQQSSGWANVAASGKSGWSSGTLKQSTPPTGMGQNGRQVQGREKLHNQPGNERKVTHGSQKQGFDSAQSSTPAEEFGTTMSPGLETWCKEQMQKINGGDDLTLVAFCMTLDDANEIRQYLTTYLGSTSQVNNFATEFINRRGLGMKQEEWETPGSAKKGRKKKSSGR
ncbi:unnamed protein product [Cylindrotheca closterium]|uniref:GYF domain-containing protein n=1 Tax=Cylindrotheca closterium TaxID=2856 RepID=A0AAD2JJM0_9STRA|nr:unnamed protein product [Cylindrotheca closterium]